MNEGTTVNDGTTTVKEGTTVNEAEPTLERTAAIARDLIRIDTTNHGGGRAVGEAEAAAYVEAELRRLGLAPTIIESTPGRTSVVARVPGRDRDAAALVVHGHLDVVPAIAEDWRVDPFAGVVRDGMLWGRGAVDMKDMDAMILTSLGDILESGRAPARDLVIAFFADEEDGGGLGSHHLVDHHPQLFEGAGQAISEVGGYSIDVDGRRAYLLQTGEKAMLWVRLVAHGAPGHGSRLVGETAVTRLARAVVRVADLEWPVQVTTTTGALLTELAAITGSGDGDGDDPNSLIASTGTAAGFLSATLRSTVNVTGLEAGYKHNVIPARAEALLDIRPLPGEERAVLERVRAAVGDDVDVEIVRQDTGLEFDFSGGLVEAIRSILATHDPEAALLPYLMPAGTDNKALSRLGITGFGFVPLRLPPELDFPAMFHGVDERVPLDALAFGRNVLTDLLLSY